jgi:3-dehydroshikimate dehydratase
MNSKMTTGIVSVTFRQLDVREIISLADQAGLDGIEWGADIHVPAGDKNLARLTGEQTRAAGLKVLSYGSYYRLLASSSPEHDFALILHTAKTLKTGNIRIWAGQISPGQAKTIDYTNAAQELKLICALADTQGITISLEYHRNTLTENADSTIKLIQMAESRNLKTYWQPNPDLTPDQNCRELTQIKPYLSNIHVFQWQENNIRDQLSEGEGDWQAYIKTAKADPARTAFIMEFVKDDNPDIFLNDAAILKQWLENSINKQSL